MATFTANSVVRAQLADLYSMLFHEDVEVLNYSKSKDAYTKLRYTDPTLTKTLEMNGLIKSSELGSVYGTVNSIIYAENGTKKYTINGSWDISSLYNTEKYGQGASGFSNFIFSENDLIKGSKFNDNLSIGRSGNDKYFGDAGNDFILTSTDFKSTVDGGTGNDYIMSAGINDLLTGGKGADIFALIDVATIKDFKHREGDNIIFYLAEGATKSAGFWDLGMNISEEYSGSFQTFKENIAVGKGIKAAQDSDDLFAYDLSSGNFYSDFDGIGGNPANLWFTLINKPRLTAKQLADDVLYFYEAERDTFAGENYWLTNFVADNFTVI